MRTLFTALALAAAPLSAQAQTAPATVAEAPIVMEARAFMASYAADLLAGRRPGIIARYDRRGVYFPMDPKGFASFAELGAIYDVDWNAPRTFEWKNLAFEALGPDAVAVTGSFLWGTGNGPAAAIAYSGLLVRQDGVLRIRIEHESLLRS